MGSLSHRSIQLANGERVTSSTHDSQGRFTHKNCVVLLTVLHAYSFVRSSRHYQAIVLGSTASTNTISTKLTRRTYSQHQNAYIIPGTGTPNQTLHFVNPTPFTASATLQLAQRLATDLSNFPPRNKVLHEIFNTPTKTSTGLHRAL
jgi:hypothetical protein